jgi:hypothetical protein
MVSFLSPFSWRISCDVSAFYELSRRVTHAYLKPGYNPYGSVRGATTTLLFFLS